MQPALPVPGTTVWIRQRRWRVERARRVGDAIRMEVAGRIGRATFLAPFDHWQAASIRDRPRRARRQKLLARLAGLLGRAASCRTLAAARDAAIDLLPYQLEPALALLEQTRRVLVADAVGLGKTIQAGVAIADLRARHPGARVLVVAPSALRRQWAAELFARFRLETRAADPAGLGDAARSAGRREPLWPTAGVWIGSIDYLKQPHVLPGAAGHAWDLLVVDEAHAVCGLSERHRAAAALARRSRQILLLSATPHNGDEAAFDRLLGLGRTSVDDDEDEDDIVVFRRTPAIVGRSALRRLRWHSIRPAPEEGRLLDALAAFERAVLERADPSRRLPALLLLSVFRKRALSTSGALLISIGRRLAFLRDPSHRREPMSDWQQPALRFEADEDDWTGEEHASVSVDVGLRSDWERAWLRRLRALARAASRTESKARYLARLARRTREPVVVFTEFRDSVRSLLPRMERVRAVAVLHGGLSGDAQQAQIDRFLSGAASVLLATDVASQGLNLQSRSRWVLNLELPWNPVRVEQRAGRVDRIGQTRQVRVGLLVARHDAESGLLGHLLRRTWAARQRFGADAIRLPELDEHAVRAHLLAGEPLADSDPPLRRIAFCDTWTRPGRAAARALIRQRALAARWRAPGASTCAEWTAAGRASAGRSAGGAILLAFSVPLFDAAGGLVERRLVFVRVERPMSYVIGRADVLEAARQTALRLVQPRARRLQRLRRAQAARAAERERAIARALADGFGPSQLQPGLFDRRALRAAEAIARIGNRIQHDLDDRLRRMEDAARVDAGAPVLELAIGTARR